jgi:hypothetical protein
MADLAAFVVSSRWPLWLRRVSLAVIWLLLLVYFYSPVRQVMDPSLDASNYSSYTYFTAHGFQYGTEVTPMAGPYGFVLYGWTYSGNLFGLRTFCELILNGALAILTLWFFRQNRGSWWRWIWLAAHIAFTPFIDDLPIEWTLLLTGIYLLQLPSQSWVWPKISVSAAVLAFLSLVKGTHLVLGLATVGVVFASYVWQRQWRCLLSLAGAYLAFFLCFWLLAGQSILHIPAYVRGILELAGGYNDAMSLEEPFHIFLRGASVFLAMVLGLGWSLWTHRRNYTTCFILILFVGFAYVQWKHGFVRADGHAYIFFHYAIVATIAAHLVAPAYRADAGRWMKSAGTLLLAGTIFASCYNEEAPMPADLLKAPVDITRHFIENVRQLSDLPAAHRDFEKELTEQRRLHNLPLVRQEVGRQTIDLFGFSHGLLPLNGLNYHPRPMGGGAFNVYTPALMRLNRDFLRDPARRPDYYLLKVESIDYHLTSQDDGLALTELLYGYQPVLAEHDHLLLKARSLSAPASPQLLSRQTFRFGDIVQVPAIDSRHLLLARFVITPNLLGRLRSALYKLPQIRVGLRGHDIKEPEGRRLIPAMVGSPFILSPVIENNRDWLGLFTDQPGKSLSTFRISTRDRTWFNKTIEVEFFTLPRPVPSNPPLVTRLLPFTETTIESVSTILPSGKPIHLIGLLLSPPGQLSWDLKGDERSVSLGYGLLPAAYLNGGTDGVEFSAILQRPGLPPLELFRRLLDPVARPDDRGHHPVEIVLPDLKPDSRLVIKTDPGPHKNNAWDWAYFSELQFKHGEFPANLFPGFNVVPTGLESNLNSMSEVDGKRLFMVHAPSALTFTLQGHEHSLQIDFGLLPAAYTGEGHNEGVDYVVEIIRAKQAPEEIFRRTVRPLTVAADRGQQSATIPLPDFKPGDHLVLRTTGTRPGNTSWAWAYVARLVLE